MLTEPAHIKWETLCMGHIMKTTTTTTTTPLASEYRCSIVVAHKMRFHVKTQRNARQTMCHI